MTNDFQEVTGVEIVPVGRQTIFDITDPGQQLEEAKRQAVEITRVIDRDKLSMRIGKSEHVLFEGWATLGAFNGASVHTVWSRRMDGDTLAWEAQCEVRTLDGRVVGTAEAMCSREESNWQHKPEFEIRSMAQTRAGSKAFKGPLSWIMVLAGKSATPAEEVGGAESATVEPPDWAKPIPDIKPFGENLERILAATANPAVARDEVGGMVWNACDSTVPRIVADTIELINQMLAQPAPAPPAGGWAPGSGLEGGTP